MKNILNASKAFFVLLAFLGAFTACQKDQNGASNKILVIDNGAINADLSQSITYQASIIDVDGNRTAATNVEWSSSESNVITISSSGQATLAGVGNAVITAKVEIDGAVLTTTAPIQIQANIAFNVAPSAILVDANFPDIQLNTVYLGTTSTTYTYASSDASVATVSSTGNVSIVGVGNCQITVTAAALNSTFIVPVTVLGIPTIQLPVARVVVSPNAYDMLKTETKQYTAKAYDIDGNEVSASFQWSVEDNTVATVDANGLVTANAIGETKVRVMADGIIGTAEVNVYPNSALLLDPFYTTIAPGNSKTFTATKHPVVRVNNELALGTGVAVTNVNWSIPTYGFSMFDIATVDNMGTVTMKQNAQAGLITTLLATDPADSEVIGSASISVGIASQCNCGTALANASSIQLLSPSTVNLTLGQSAQIQANVLDAQGNVISGANLVYCSDDVQVANVDAFGSISAASFFTNTTTVTVCHGNLTETITVNVQ